MWLGLSLAGPLLRPSDDQTVNSRVKLHSWLADRTRPPRSQLEEGKELRQFH